MYRINFHQGHSFGINVWFTPISSHVITFTLFHYFPFGRMVVRNGQQEKPEYKEENVAKM
jgi:hypothetical protein